MTATAQQHWSQIRVFLEMGVLEVVVCCSVAPVTRSYKLSQPILVFSVLKPSNVASNLAGQELATTQKKSPLIPQ